MNEARLAWLERVEAEAGDGPLEVEKVLESFFLPTVEVASRNPGFVRLMGQMLAEGMMPRIVEKHFQARACVSWRLCDARCRNCHRKN